MSSKEDLVIQADNVTIVQGEKAKDYNVIVTSLDNAPLSNIPITIAFYNNDYSFERQTTTNEYGVASVPLYLGGDAWFVDVHFKGNEQYKPQVVTKEIIIEKFERLDSYITSENLVINIDEESMNGTYYTIYLKNSYDRPISNEPVAIVVEQTGVEKPQVYIDMILKTDNDGKIKVPFLSHDENVKITTRYYDCTRYKGCVNADIVSFTEVAPRDKVEFRWSILGGWYYCLEYKLNDGNWVEVNNDERHIVRPIVNPNNQLYSNYDVGSGWFFVDSLGDGIYDLTLCYEGRKGAIGELGNTYPFCRTFRYTEPNDNRKSIAGWIESQGGSDKYTFEITNNIVGKMAHITLTLEYELPFDIVNLELSSSEIYTALPKYEQTNNYYKRTILEYDIINPTRETGGNHFQFVSGSTSPYINPTDPFHIDKVVTLTNEYWVGTTTLSQTGFGAEQQTYQNIDIIVSNEKTAMHQKVNDYCLIHLINIDTLEEFYFATYLIDKVTPSHLEFNLGVGYWRLEIVSKERDSLYQGVFYKAEANITTDTPVVPPSNNIIVNSENYIDLGTDTPTFIDNTITTATTDDDIHSIMALEFTNSNYYRLSFNAEVTGDTAIVYGADPTLTTMDGLFINNDSITLYNDGLEMDKLIFDTPLFSQANNNVLIQRYGNQFTIFVNDEQVYKTELLSWNTFGVYQNATGSEIKLSYFALEPYITTEITPSVADYDGTIFGSNIHLEIDDNKLNMIDYGMLPSGAIGGGKIILNDVPLESANKYAIQLEMKYNNTRFERLNNLTGQMQMRVYEDILSTDTVKDYEKTLCSPMPVPNSRTVFTRHSDEGILYFVQDPLNANSSFLTNAYNQYKGGVEITTETGISLFNLDNAYSPVYVGNELVRAEFHRRSGFIRISRYDETSGDWVNVNTFKLRNYPQLSLNDYDDDYAEIQFGNTTWKFYRGRPFIVLNHPQDDLRIMNLVDRVYCETVENQRGMGFIVDQNPNEQTTVTDENGTVLGYYSTFNPQLSIQQFKQELHIGENIRLDNFELYEADSNQNIGDVATNSQLGILHIDNDNALQIYKDDTNLALNFPSYSSYVERVNDTFTLSIDYLDCPFGNIKIKARGFDDKGAVPVKDNIQYGIWEQTVDVKVDTTATDSVRATFTNCPSEVKYIDFVIFFTGANSTDIIMKDLMYYDGDAILNHDVDTSRVFAEQVTINFADTYFANIYNNKDNCGLCIARPNQEPFTLTSLKASSETVLIPYMKKATEWDKPQQVFLEYLNAKQQVIDIDWEN